MTTSSSPAPDEPLARRLAEVAGLFLKLGLTAYGGPAAHIAMMHDEVVKRRKWLAERYYSGYAPERVARPSIPKGHAVLAQSTLVAAQTGVWRPPSSIRLSSNER